MTTDEAAAEQEKLRAIRLMLALKTGDWPIVTTNYGVSSFVFEGVPYEIRPATPPPNGNDGWTTDQFRDHTSVTITVQEVANRLHQDIYGADSEHLSLHSCPCFLLARWYLGVSDKPKLRRGRE